MSRCDSETGPSRIAYILAGGKSSRFGSSKALVGTAGIPQIQRLAQELAADSWQSVAVAQSADEFEPLGVRTVADLEPDQGPVAGILAGLSDFRSIDFRSVGPSCPIWPWALFLTCDLWRWDARWTEALRPPEVGSDSGKISSEGVLLVHFKAQRFTPFPCLIHRDALPTLQKSWDSGCRSMRQLFEILAPATLSRELSGVDLPASFNTPEELEQLRREQQGS